MIKYRANAEIFELQDYALKKILGVSELNTFETGVKYQMYNSLFLLFVGTSNDISNKAKKGI